MTFQTISVEIKDSVLWCRLNRPELRNAFNPEMIAELATLSELISEEVRAVVLSGEGNVFSAGGDLNWMRQSLNLSREENIDDAMKLANMLLALDRLHVPLVGMIHGAAMGGGIGLVSVCDYAIASTDTIFSFSEVKLGIIPACIAPFVLRKIGPGHARALFTTAERFHADKAYDIGLIHQIASNRDELLQLIEKKVQEIKECGPNALRIAKKIIFDLLNPDDSQQLKFVAEVLAGVRTSEEGQEGLMSFLEKRKPNWSNPSR
jgi:methylglutaconyl-CoA hydratase